MNNIRRELTEKVNTLDISEQEKDVLLEILTDPHGLPANTAYSMIPRITGLSSDVENQRILADLIAGGYITKIEVENISYLCANFQKIGIPQELSDVLFDIGKIHFNIMGYPHSPNAMQTLSDIFCDEKETIYVALGITSHEVFKDMLEARANRSYETIFLIPSKKHVSTAEIEHYNTIICSWRKYLSESAKRIRAKTKIRIVTNDFKSLYTTLYTANVCRFNIRPLDTQTTRSGTIIQIPAGTTLHNIMGELYKRLQHDSHPDFRLHRSMYIREFLLKRHTFAIVFGIAAIVLVVLLGWQLLSVGIASTIVGNYVFKLINGS